jgi:capsular exopolysaccharide synthesis family protein
MSKNFELMQQAGRERELTLGHTFESVPAPAPPVPSLADGNGNSHQMEARFNLDDVTREECLRLVQRIFLLQSEESPKLVVFAGVDHGNGCSQICAAAAETLAKTVRSPICLVEANLRTPSLPDRFGVQNHFGLTNALLEEGDVKSFAKPIQENLWLVSSGALSSDSPNLLNSLRLKKRFAELREEFEYVLVDAPPLTRYADAVALAQSADGVVLVLEANSTRREAALQAAEDLRNGQVRVLGAVLNKRTFPIPESLYRRL